MNSKFLISLLIAIALVGAYILIFSGASKKQGEKTEIEVQDEIKIVQAKIYDLKSQDTAEGIDTEIRNLRQEIMQASSSFPKDFGITSLLKDLAIIADSNGLQMLLFEPMEPINQSVYEEIPIKLRVRGSYKQVASFLYGVSNLNKIINIQDMKMVGPINNSSFVMTDTEILISAYRILGGGG
ncbi:MAG: type 4a pilus biogenesis protein PilO [Pseudomonadota bacterium]